MLLLCRGELGAESLPPSLLSIRVYVEHTQFAAGCRAHADAGRHGHADGDAVLCAAAAAGGSGWRRTCADVRAGARPAAEGEQLIETDATGDDGGVDDGGDAANNGDSHSGEGATAAAVVCAGFFLSFPLRYALPYYC